MQDTLIGVYSKWPRLHTSGVPDAYARTTLVNAFRSSLRRPWRREQATEVMPDAPDAYAHRHDGFDQRDLLLAALAELGPSQRAVVVLRFWDDLSVAETADILDISIGTVKSQSARGLQALRRVVDAAETERSSIQSYTNGDTDDALRH